MLFQFQTFLQYDRVAIHFKNPLIRYFLVDVRCVNTYLSINTFHSNEFHKLNLKFMFVQFFKILRYHLLLGQVRLLGTFNRVLCFNLNIMYALKCTALNFCTKLENIINAPRKYILDLNCRSVCQMFIYVLFSYIMLLVRNLVKWVQVLYFSKFYIV